jgi:signal transduction histidine kinase
VRISDTGAGIPEEARERIFDLGFTTRGAAGGSGLGLALCRRIVEDHGGSIEVEGVAGRGTTFTVRIPTEPTA